MYKLISLFLIFNLANVWANDQENFQKNFQKIDLKELLGMTKSKDTKIADIATLLYSEHAEITKAYPVAVAASLTQEKLKKMQNAKLSEIDKIYTELVIVEGDFNPDKLYSRCALANILINNGNQVIALTLLQPLITQIKNVPIRVISAESISRIFLEQQELKKARETINFALSLCGKILKDSKAGDYEQLKLSKVEFLLISHWQEKLNKLNAQLKTLEEIEKYGTDWVLYKMAEEARLKGEFVKAYLIFDEIVQYFPKTVYAEYARFKAIELLLTGKLNLKIDKAYKQVYPITQNELLKGGKTFFELEKNRKINEQNFNEFRINDTPKTLMKKFIEENKYGLYRGEAYLALVQYGLFNIKNGELEEALKKTEEWLTEVKNFDHLLENMELPIKVREVSSPPKANIGFDDWGNEVELTIKPGVVFNRKTSDFYLNYLWTLLLGKKGVYYFSIEKYDEALWAFNTLYDHNKHWQKMREEGNFSTPRRLIAGATGQYFQATKEILKHFKKDQQAYTLLILAEYYYFSKQWDLGINLYKKIMDFKSLDKEAQAYLYIAVARTSDMKFADASKAETTIELFEKVLKPEFRGTAAYNDALFCAANSSMQLDIPYKEKGIKYLDELIKSTKNPELKEKAMMTKVTIFSSLIPGKPAIWNKHKAHEAAREFLKNYPDSTYQSMLDFIMSDKKMQLDEPK